MLDMKGYGLLMKTYDVDWGRERVREREREPANLDNQLSDVQATIS